MIGGGVFYAGVDVDELAHLLTDILVEIDQKRVLSFKKRTDIVGIVVEKRTLAISTLQGIPMHSPPLVVVADAEIFDY